MSILEAKIENQLAAKSRGYMSRSHIWVWLPQVRNFAFQQSVCTLRFYDDILWRLNVKRTWELLNWSLRHTKKNLPPAAITLISLKAQKHVRSHQWLSTSEVTWHCPEKITSNTTVKTLTKHNTGKKEKKIIHITHKNILTQKYNYGVIDWVSGYTVLALFPFSTCTKTQFGDPNIE